MLSGDDYFIYPSESSDYEESSDSDIEKEIRETEGNISLIHTDIEKMVAMLKGIFTSVIVILLCLF